MLKLTLLEAAENEPPAAIQAEKATVCPWSAITSAERTCWPMQMGCVLVLEAARWIVSALAKPAGRLDVVLATVTEAHAAWRADAAAQDRQRLTEMSGTLAAMAASLQHEWQAAGDRTLAGQERLCRTLEETAGGLAAATQSQASRTIAEVTRLMETAAEAPRAAAEVIGRLRQELSASMARDNALLDERSRIMETLAALLDGINHASTEQRAAIDALVTSCRDRPTTNSPVGPTTTQWSMQCRTR